MRRLLLKLIRRRQLERDLEAELAFHREMASGHSDAIPLGNTTALKEQARDLWRFVVLENLWSDVLYGARSLRRSRALVASAVLSLGLAIGANTSIFSLAVELLFSEPSVGDPESVVGLRIGGNSHASRKVLEFLRRTGVFAEVVGENEEAVLNWDNGVETRRIFSVHVTKNYFDVLRVPMAYGRGIRPDDPDEVVVLSHRFWRTRLGGDPAVLGRSLRLDGRPYAVIGILRPDHRSLTGFGTSQDVYVPRYLEDTLLALYARLKPGMSRAQAEAGLVMAARQLDTVYPEQWQYAHNCRVEPLVGIARLRQESLLAVGLFFLMLLIVVGLVLLIACINVASLLLARATARRQEFAVRLSLGASRSRLVQQLLVESLLLSLLGAGFGLLLRYAIARAFEEITLPLPIPIRLQLPFNSRVSLYAALLASVATITCGLLPAWRAVKESLSGDLARERKLRMQRGLVVAQIAISLVVLMTGALFVRNLLEASAMSPGFDVQHTLRAEVQLPPTEYRDTARKRAYLATALAALQNLPGIEGAAAARIVPFTDATRFRVGMKLPETGETTQVFYHWNAVTEDYFRVLGIPIRQGREFLGSDRTSTPRPVVVNDVFVQKYLPGGPAVGRQIELAEKTRYVIVGVAATTKNMTIGEDPKPQLYEHLALIQNDRPRLQFVLRSAVPPGAQLNAVRDALRRLEPDAGLEVNTLYASIGLAFLPSQVGAALLGSVGLLGLALATIGISGVMMYSVTRRTREIGVRMAIGASPGDVARNVLTDAAKLVALGVAIGLSVAVFVTKPVAMFLVPGLHPTDPFSFVAVVALFAVTGFLAAWGPMRRAVATNPVLSLRHE